MSTTTKTESELRIERAKELHQKQRAKNAERLLNTCERALGSNRIDAEFIREALAHTVCIYERDDDGAISGIEMTLSDIMKELLPDYLERMDRIEQEKKADASRKRKEAQERKIRAAAEKLLEERQRQGLQ